jgi:16S rRNA (guanine527-N7)-methyltransferase
VTDAGATRVPQLPVAPAAAVQVFGDRLAAAKHYVELLATDAVVRGLIGPREVDRLWQRHLLNCAALGQLLPAGAVVVDVGSGAGLPGIPLALARPDVRVALLEPLERRVQFLHEALSVLGLEQQVRVVRGRAEDRSTRTSLDAVDWVTARAVAPLDRLVRWCLPLLTPGGRLLALKGASVREEIDRYEQSMRSAGAASVEVREIGATSGTTTWVAVVSRAAAGLSRKGSA